MYLPNHTFTDKILVKVDIQAEYCWRRFWHNG